MARKKNGKRKRYLIGPLIFLLVMIVSILLRYDPEADEVEFVTRKYVGNLQTEAFLSAGHFVYPQNLIDLKHSAILKAGMNEGFRQEILRAMNVASLEELTRVPKERFFDFLVKRSFAYYKSTFEMIKKGTVIGVKVRRKKDNAWVQVSFRLVEDSIQKRFRMRLALKKENAWFVLLYE